MPKTKKQQDTSNKPWVSNYPPLAEWLKKIDARCMWQVPSNPEPSGDDYDSNWHPQFYVEGYVSPNGSVPFVVIVRANKMGWEILTAHPTALIPDTLADAEQRIGFKEK